MSSGWHSFFAALALVCPQIPPICFDVGNGYSFGCLAKYILSISAVAAFSLYVPESCIFMPVMLIIPCSWSMFFLLVISSSWASAPVSISILKIVA